MKIYVINTRSIVFQQYLPLIFPLHLLLPKLGRVHHFFNHCYFTNLEGVEINSLNVSQHELMLL